MTKVHISTGNGYDILIGSGLISQSGSLIKEMVGSCKIGIVTDSNVSKLYLKNVVQSLRSEEYEVSTFTFPAGEASKSMSTLTKVLNFLAENKFSRKDVVIALGGGVTGDLTGFAAGCYMRGIKFIQMPTTLLAAVDSSVGGKTAVDLPEGKNLAGLFYQPSGVICDTDCLATLSDHEISNGMAEVIKAAILDGEDFFESLENGNAMDDPNTLVERCVSYKKKVVEEDPKEKGCRKFLNLGHTIGHSIEKASKYTISHGYAVAIGLAIISRASSRLYLCTEETSNRIVALLKKYNLPIECEFSANELVTGAMNDKKREGGDITLIIPCEIGKCKMEIMPVSRLFNIVASGREVHL